MDTKINQKSETKKEIEVTISVSEMEDYKKKAAEKMGGEMNIKGFRPGQAPIEVIENTVSKEKFYEEAAKIAIEESYPQIIKENKFFALGDPQVNLVKCNPGEEVIYKAQVYIMPEINLPDYKKIGDDIVKETEEDIEIKEEEIEQAINRIRETKAKLQKVDREAKEGDGVVINFKGIIGNEEDKKIEEKDFQVNLGKGELQVLEGFEDNLIGMKAGEKKSFPINVSKDKAKEKDIAGKEINFEVEMVTVMERELPEVDDDFAKNFPQIESLSQLKEKIKEGIGKEKENKKREETKTKILKKIKEDANEFEIPEVLVEKELDNMLKNADNQLKGNNSSLEIYLKETGKSKEDLRNDWRQKAQENVAYALLLHKIGEKENIEVKPEEIEEELERYFAASGKNKNEENEESLQRLRAYIHDTIKNKKVFQLLSVSKE